MNSILHTGREVIGVGPMTGTPSELFLSLVVVLLVIGVLGFVLKQQLAT